MVVGRVASRLGCCPLCHEGGGGSVGDDGGLLCWALLLPGVGWLGPEVLEDVLGGSGLRCCPVARPGLGLGFGSGLRLRCSDSFE